MHHEASDKSFGSPHVSRAVTQICLWCCVSTLAYCSDCRQLQALSFLMANTSCVLIPVSYVLLLPRIRLHDDEEKTSAATSIPRACAGEIGFNAGDRSVLLNQINTRRDGLPARALIASCEGDEISVGVQFLLCAP